MDKATQMSAFVRAVDTGSFTGAARAMELTPSAISKLITRLEDRLDVRLLHRTTRKLQLTAEGEQFYTRARDILAALDETEADVGQSASRARGLLRLRSGSAFGVHQLPLAMPAFRQRYPEVDVDITITDQPSRFKNESFDLAISAGPLDDSSWVARRFASAERIVCAAPFYLAHYGTPRTPQDLKQHNCLWVSPLPDLRFWPFTTPDGVEVVQVNGGLSANNTATLLQLAIAGGGIARLPDVMVGPALRAGALVPVLQDWHHQEDVPLYATYPSGRHLSPKVRAMVDFLVEHFAHAPWRSAGESSRSAATANDT